MTAHDATIVERIGAVAIGRNEGVRLRACLESLVGRVGTVVYVDSGSTDGSAELARSLGAHVVALDMSIPFTAARARNEGFARVRESSPEAEFVQFVDGDCELRPEWLPQAVEAMRHDDRLAVVCGRRRERFPKASTFNRLCDLEWDTPVGEAKACGGDALMRVAALVEVGGYDPELIAGEEPEMCVRLRRAGWRIRRLPVEMTWHDAAMMHWSQWWRRNVRAGHAFAEGADRHGAPPERHWVREVRSNWFWGLVVPVSAVAAAWPTAGLSFVVALCSYVLLALRVYRRCRRRLFTVRESLTYALFIVLGKFPLVVGQMQYHVNRRRGRRTGLIEYKRAASA